MTTYTTKKTNIKQLNLASELIHGISKMNYEYIYRGEFTHPILNNILAITSINLDKAEDTYKLKRKIYFIVVECLQNIAKHQDKTKDVEGNDSAIMVIQKRNQRYYLTTGNIIENKNVAELTEKLETINNMTNNELKEYYKKVLVNGSISSKGGAGLGLISMARKTGNKLYYDFQKLDDKISNFYLRTEIPLTSVFDKENDEEKTKWKYSFDKVKLMHKVLIKEKILLNFSGSFDQDHLINLMPIVDAQLYNNADHKERIFIIMYEMLQNIVNYSEDYSSTKRSVGNNEGIFLLSNIKDKFYFTAGNYIHNSVTKILQGKIDFVNKANETELNEFHKNIFKFFRKGDVKKPDISIIEMKLKSRNALSYQFTNVSDEYSFFALQTCINQDYKNFF